MFQEILDNVRKQRPLIHNITNYVSANDCANMLLACGASGIMADEVEEVREVMAMCAGLNVNIGTLNEKTLAAMMAAAKQANELSRPAVFDLVGAGISIMRRYAALSLVRKNHFTIIKGNISEIKALAAGKKMVTGVDVAKEDEITEETLPQAVDFTKDFARKMQTIIAITGAIDIVTDGEKAYCIFNGNPMMRSVSGTGCQVSCLVAAYLAANPQQPLEAAAAAVCAMGLCGEIAFSRMTEMDGNATYRNYIIDAMYHLDGKTLEEKANFKIL